MIDPRTPEEWAEAIAGAEFLLEVDAAVQYGLIEINFAIDIPRCEEILERAAALGYR